MINLFSKFSSSVLILLLLMVSNSFQELIVLHYPPFNSSIKKLTCISDGDDNAALIWNDNLQHSTFHNDEKKFSLRDCETRNISYNKGWKKVRSFDIPMGPVHDYRWEDFDELKLKKNEKYTVNDINPQSCDTLVISFRGKGYLSVSLMRNDAPARLPLSRINIGERWQRGSKSSIHYSNNSILNMLTQVEHNSERIVDQRQWRTFRIKWIKNRRTIQIFKDTNDTPFIQGYIPIWYSVSHISITSDEEARVRFHKYNYFLTREKNSIISTSKFNPSDENLSVDLFVGLCPRCKLVVSVINQNNDNKELVTISGNVDSAHYQTLYWKSIKLNITSEIIQSGPINLQIKSILDQNQINGQWAIDDIRTCESKEKSRQSTISINYKDTNQLICQRLSDREGISVDSFSQMKIYHGKDRIRNVLIDWMKSHIPTTIIRNWSFCNSNGCSCNKGFMGEKCTQECRDDNYGYNCNRKQMFCRHDDLNKETGYCYSACVNNKLLPLCDKDLEIPNIKEITDTSVTISQQFDRESYANIEKFWIEIQGDIGRRVPQFEGKRLNDTFTYVVNITDLKTNLNFTIYWIALLKMQTNYETHWISADNYFITSSNWRCYQVIKGREKLILKFNSDMKGCSALNKYYSVKLQSISSPSQTTYVRSWLPQLEFNDLNSDFYYKISISSDRQEIFTTVSKPLKSKYLTLSSVSVSDTKVTLKWDPIYENMHDDITEYNLSIKLIKYLGCEADSDTINSDEIIKTVYDNTISIDNLNPYSEYTTFVSCRDGISNKINFKTIEKYIPTSVVSNLRIENSTILLWDKLENCTKITGPVKFVRLIIESNDEWANNFVYRTDYKLTDYFINLNKVKLIPYTTYKIRLHVIRDKKKPENLNEYEELIYKTSQKEPPNVSNLSIYDADVEKNVISLRWEPPYPPYGELESYHVSVNEREYIFETEYSGNSMKLNVCELWKNHVCLENVNVQHWFMDNEIRIYAKNKNVEKRGNVTVLAFSLNIFDQAPSKVEHFTQTIASQNRVKLSWNYPFSLTKIIEFNITVDFVVTNLQKSKIKDFPTTFNYKIKQGEKSYSQILPLESSTTYRISMISINQHKTKSDEFVNYVTTENNYYFLNEIEYELDDTLIKLIIPEIANPTLNAKVIVTIEGLLGCMKNNHPSSPITPKNTVIKYDEYEMREQQSKQLTIGTNHATISNLNCSLYIGETYNISIIAKYSGSEYTTLVSLSIDLTKNNSLLLWLSIIPILIMISVIFYILHKNYYKFNGYKENNLNFARSQTPRKVVYFTSLFKRQSSSILTQQLNNRDSEHIYAIPDVSNSRSISKEYFSQYVENSAESGIISSQYMTLPRKLTKPCFYGKLPENISKNKAINQIAYDDTRVKLEKLPHDPYSDYINASYIEDYLNDKAYIATQNPMTNTVNDFWRMIWEKKIYIICMISDTTSEEETNCEKYWPEVGTKKTYGEVTVWNNEHTVFTDYTIRNFKITYQKYKRKITQLHYTAWPENDIPTYPQPLVAYLKKVSETQTGNAPIVVHCSTGDGRTGTLILCDICLRQAKSKDVIDVLAATNRMLDNRANMVGSSEQYLLAHIVIIESLNGSPTQVSCTNNFPTEIQKMRKKLKSDMKRLNETEWQERALYTCLMPKYPTPGDFSMKILSKLNSVGPDAVYFARSSKINYEDNYYIGTVSVDGANKKKQYLASQLPSQSTRPDFWRLIVENNIELIIILQQCQPDNTSCCDIFPKKSSFAPLKNINVELIGKKREKYHTIKQLLLTDTTENEAKLQSITVIRCIGWEVDKNGKPPSVNDLVSFWRILEGIPKEDGQILLLCSDGITGCGLYLALNFILEKMTTHGECDVISAIRAIRRFRPEFVTDEEQVEYLYDAAIHYFKCFETYANL